MVSRQREEHLSSQRDNARFYKRCKYEKGIHPQVYLQGRIPFFVFIARQRDMSKTRSVCEWQRLEYLRGTNNKQGRDSFLLIVYKGKSMEVLGMV